jgi:hypothetical protein
MTSSEQYLRSQHGGLGVVKRAGYGRAMTLEGWATAQAARLIAPLGDRWTHVQVVADKAHGLAAELLAEDADLLVAAALVHDVGYALSLQRSASMPWTAPGSFAPRAKSGWLLSNPEIGSQLFLSARTVEWHLRKVFPSLPA